MIVEHITRYSFDPTIEAKELKRYMSMLPNWECEQVGKRCVTLSYHEANIVDKTESEEEK